MLEAEFEFPSELEISVVPEMLIDYHQSECRVPIHHLFTFHHLYSCIGSLRHSLHPSPSTGLDQRCWTMDAMAAPIAGPNALLRYLRAARDPPSTGGPSKISLATSAWRDQGSEIPHLGEILRDWILSVWIDLNGGSATHPLLDAAHHDLMLAVLRATRTGLPAIALTRLFVLLLDHPSHTTVTEHEVWSLTSQDTTSTPDAWFDAWSAMLALLAQSSSAHALSRDLASTVESALRRSLQGPSIHKRVMSVIPSLVSNLSRAIAHGISLDAALTGSVFFPASILKAGGSVDIVLKSWSDSGATASFIPHLLQSYQSALWQHRHDIYIQPTSSRVAHDTYINDKIRTAIRLAFEACHLALSSSLGAGQVQYWRHKTLCWELVAHWGVYLATDPTWAQLLRTEAANGRALMETEQDVLLLEGVLACLGAMEGLDHHNTGLDTTVFAWCIASPPQLHDRAAHVLRESLRYHQVTRTDEVWIGHVLDGLQSLASPSLDQRSAQAVQDLVSSGPLWDSTLLRALEATKRRSPVCQLLKERLRILSPDEHNTTSIVVGAISRLAEAVAPLGVDVADDLVSAAEAVLGFIKAGRATESVPSARDLGLASLLRLGRQAAPHVQERLEQHYELWSSQDEPKGHHELLHERLSWVLVRLPQTADLKSNWNLEDLIEPPSTLSPSTKDLASPGDITASDLNIIQYVLLNGCSLTTF